MPFFSQQTPEQIRTYCIAQNLEELVKLNQRYGVFFEKINMKKDENMRNINDIEHKINLVGLEIKAIEQRNEKAKKYRQDILENLPSDGAERYLVLQSVSGVTHFESDTHLTEKLLNLKKQKQTLIQNNAWIRNEVHGCIQELRIINSVLEEKKKDNELKMVENSFGY